MLKDFEDSNWILEKYSGFYKVLSLNYSEFHKDFFKKNKIPSKGGNNTLVNWNKITPKYEFIYELQYEKKLISKWLIDSSLSIYKNIIVEFDSDQPIISIDMRIFIENWYDFASYSGFVGIAMFTEDAKLLLEFSDRKEYKLYSNFKIVPAGAPLV